MVHAAEAVAATDGPVDGVRPQLELLLDLIQQLKRRQRGPATAGCFSVIGGEGGRLCVRISSVKQLISHLSILLQNVKIGRPFSRQTSNSLRVCGSRPVSSVNGGALGRSTSVQLDKVPCTSLQLLTVQCICGAKQPRVLGCSRAGRCAS